MNCSNCQTANPAEARFCMKCGTPLVNTCSNCQIELPASAAFCFKCGQAVNAVSAPSPAPPSASASPVEERLAQYIPKELLKKLDSARKQGGMLGERRIVTMLFCDVQGSTAAAEKLDPEEWAEIMNGAFEHLISPVYRYEGTLARLMGDAILAFFGAPIAHEDDPQRAVLAGLEILESIGPYRQQIKREWGVDFDVRVGINTGLVVVGEVGSDLRVEYTAMGDAVNLAARMEQTAQAGTVQISENTHKLVAPLFKTLDLGGIEVKGKRAPVNAYQVLGQKAEPGRLRGIEGLESPLIGRDAEMHTLRGAVIDLRKGRGQIISVMGEAGLGKSRLIAELRKSPTPVAEGKAKLRWIEGRSLSYETSTPYAPFIDLFNNLFQLESDAPDEANYQRIKAFISQNAPAQVTQISPYIGSLMKLKFGGEDNERVRYLEPPQLRGRVFEAVSALFEALAVERPLVLVFDDVHWIDPTSLELLEQLLPLTNRATMMLVALFRPRREEPSWRFHETCAREYSHRYSALSLQPLDDENARELVSNLLEIEGLPEKVRKLILSKSEGNPFYVEEVIRSLLDEKLVVRDGDTWRATREIEDVAVPDTLTAVLTTRLDRLDDEAKRAAQTAAVIGRVFSHTALQRASDDPDEVLESALTILERRELVREKSRVPQRIHMFKHVLIQETAYASLLLKKRRELHARVADCLENNEPEQFNEIAHHLLEARQYQRALPYLVSAGDRAAHAYATPEAIGYYTQALTILETVDDLPLARRAYEGLGNALTLANEVERAVETYQAMYDIAIAGQDIPMQISALNKKAQAQALYMGQLPQAEPALVDAERLAREYEDQIGLSELFTIRCQVCGFAADFDGVVRYMDESVQLGRTLNIKEQMAEGLDHIAFTMLYMLRFDEAWQAAQEALEISREIGNLEHEAGAYSLTLAGYYLLKGDLDQAFQMAQKGWQLAAPIGVSIPEVIGASYMGQVAQARGDYQQALAHYHTALQASQKAGFIWSIAEYLSRIGAIYLDISPAYLKQAVEFHQQVGALLEEHPAAAMFGASVWVELGFCVTAVGQFEQADKLFQQGLTHPTMPMNLEKPKLLTGQAYLALAQNQLNKAQEAIQQARTFAEENQMLNTYPMIALAEGEVHLALNQAEQALESFNRAESTAQTMQMRPILWQAQLKAAQVLAKQGRTSEATAKQSAAQTNIDEIAGLFTDADLRTTFLDHANSQLTLAH